MAMADNNVSQFGKICYFDPNRILQDKMYDSKSVSYNLPQNLEDYSINVDLIVTTPKRFGNAQNKGETHVISLLGNGEDISFFGGTDGWMTSDPGSTTYYDILNGNLNGAKESLGITNIHISYNSYFYPEVTITFTDIRGAALMGPNEENYRREQVNKVTGEVYYSTKVESFFSSLFSFPYPEFKLRIKGFYGKMIEYSLIVSDFRSAFNSQTGNFDATVSFIGKMFGVYTDIPMSYLFMAPYCKYGGVNNKTLWQERQFEIEDGEPMPTLLELRNKIITAHQNLASDLTFLKVKEYTDSRKQISEITELKKNYKELYSYLQIKFGNDKTHGVILGIPLIEDVYLFEAQTTNFKNSVGSYTYTNASYLYDNNEELLTITQKIYDSIVKYNESNDPKIEFLGELNQRTSQIGNGAHLGHASTIICRRKGDDIVVFKEYLTDVTKNNEIFKNLEFADENYRLGTGTTLSSLASISVADGGYPTLFNKLKNYLINNLTDNGEKRFVVLDCTNFSESLRKQEDKINEEIEGIKQNINEEYGTQIATLLGFKPTIRNVFKIILAHLQIFVEIYSSFLRNVTGVNARKLRDYGLNLDETDLPDTISDYDIDLPPFPAVKNKQTNEFAYPSTVVMTKPMEEENLIDAFFDGSFLLLKEKLETDRTLDLLRDETLDFIPTCITDLVIGNNPYKHTFSQNEGTINVDWIMTFFGARCITRLVHEQNDKLTDDEFAKCEAYNFWRVNKGLSLEDIEKINSSSFDGSNFLKFITGDKTCPYFENGKPCYSFNCVENKEPKKKHTTVKQFNYLLYYCDKTNGLLAPGRYNSPIAIGRDNGGFNTYLADMNSTALYSMPGCGRDDAAYRNYSTDWGGLIEPSSVYTPQHYLTLIDSDFLKEWNLKISNADLSNYINEGGKKNLIEHYLSVNSEMFNNQTIWFRTSDIPANNFFTLYEEGSLFDGCSDLKTFYSKNADESYILDSIRNHAYTPIFLEDNLTPENFLCNIPFKLEKIPDLWREGHNCYALPYVMVLFLGMCLKTIKDGNFDNVIARIHANFGSIYLESDLNLWTNLDMWDRPSKDVYFLLRWKKRIFDVFTYLGVFNEINSSAALIDTPYYLVPGTEEYIEKREKGIKDYARRDSFGLIKEYEGWAKSKKPGGFLYLKEMYELKNTSGKSLLKLCQEVGVNSAADNVKTIKNHFNSAFKSPKNNSNAQRTDFTDRYAGVTYIEDDENYKVSFNKDFVAYEHLMNLFKNYKIMINPYSYEYKRVIKTNSQAVEASKYSTLFDVFKSTLTELYKDIDPETGEDRNRSHEFSSSLVTDESKLSMYLTLKNLQDKYFFNLHNNTDTFDITKNNSEWSRFHFIDTFYNDIGDELLINASQLEEVINTIMNGYESGTGEGIVQSQLSVYSFLANLCQKHNLMFMALPVFNGSFNKEEGAQNLSDMFTPMSYDESLKKSIMQGPSYVCFYPHQPSHHLNISGSEYNDDGFLITDDKPKGIEDINDTATFTGPITISDLTSEEKTQNSQYIIPAFGVEYGNMNQSIFKNVNVNMDNPMVTEYSVAAQFNLAQGMQTESRKLSFEGQNLFNVYSNHSYTCSAEMMGCAQIQPLMYFQLNNIPMFRGAYQIINVEHNITPGDMTTTFKGVRINKNKIPMVKASINFNSILNTMNNVTSFNIEKAKKGKDKFTGTLLTKVGDGLASIPKDVNYTYDKCMTDLKNYFSMENVDSHSSKEAAFNDGNPYLRMLIYAIAKQGKETFKTGVHITSLTRANSPYSPDKKSDHSIGKMVDGKWVFNGAARREKITGIDGYGNTKKYSEMGCAVDFHGRLENGAIDKVNGSVRLFNLVALNFTDSIRQLIWEVKKDTPTNDESISNCIHLSSYGPRGEGGTDTTEIFVSSGADPWKSVVANNGKNIDKAPTNLPRMFIYTLYQLAKAGKLTDDIKLYNFSKANIPNSALTATRLANWYNELSD